jgi:hypothetical protein
MGCLGLLGPEFIFQLAIGQWASARRSFLQFKNSGYPQWSMKHAFLADMGGFALHPPDFAPFVLDAKQVHFLVTEGYISYSAVSVDMAVIEDKNKSDTVVRFITVCQIVWFTLNCLGRLIQHLTLTTLEVTTLGFIACTLGTYLAWAHKPMDVTHQIILVPNTTMADILIKAGEKARVPYKFTPLDFVSHNNWSWDLTYWNLSSWNLYWTYWMNILRKLGIVFVSKRRPIRHIQDDNFPPLSRSTMAILFLIQTIYAGIHIAAWNFHFPTPTESLLWHISTLYIMGSVIFGWVFDLYPHLHPKLRNQLRLRRLAEPQDLEARSGDEYFSSIRAKMRSFAEGLRNNSPGRDPALAVPLKVLIPMTALAAVYCFARAYTLVEDIVSLRCQPANAYDSINWSAFLPHI